jgi:hypothetical protein
MGEACLPVGREEYFERRKEVGQIEKEKKGEEPCQRNL